MSGPPLGLGFNSTAAPPAPMNRPSPKYLSNENVSGRNFFLESFVQPFKFDSSAVPGFHQKSD